VELGNVKQRKQIAIVSHAEDIHALAVRDVLRRYSDVDCAIIESNRIADNGHLHWSADQGAGHKSSIPTSDGGVIHPTDLNAVWWRRANHAQQLPPDLTCPASVDLINNDSKEALLGILMADFRGRWVSEPSYTVRADNKLVQLHAAQEVGLAVPRTIVSQDVTEVRQFCSSCDHQVVVKAVRGTHRRRTLTRLLPPAEELTEDLVRLCPTIYQEYVPGTDHVRAHCFGDQIHSISIYSEEIDWRQNLDVPMISVTLPPETNESLLRIHELLGLRMGIVDLKLLPSGEPILLEINPQGQFLFIQAISGYDLLTPFADFLYEEAGRM
jgi:hypothetical protein